MAYEKKLPLTTDQQRIAKLENEVRAMNLQLRQMLHTGGFADSKTLSQRSARIEERVEKLELDGTMLKDIAGMLADWLAKHLLERHAVPEQDNSPDSIIFRKIRRRLAEWLEKRGLMDKRRDVSSARNDENRLRPAREPAHS